MGYRELLTCAREEEDSFRRASYLPQYVVPQAFPVCALGPLSPTGGRAPSRCTKGFESAIVLILRSHAVRLVGDRPLALYLPRVITKKDPPKGRLFPDSCIDRWIAGQALGSFCRARILINRAKVLWRRGKNGTLPEGAHDTSGDETDCPAWLGITSRS